ncbi:MAG: EamA family transporter [bacterium]|nr:EamA family transporter [bacterium]
MPLWLLVVIGAHLLNAVAFLIDKFLLAKTVPKPSVYAFFVGALGGLTFVLLPFDFQIPTAGQAVLDFAAGATFVLALLLFFTALKRGEASRIVPYIGGTIPIWTFLIAYLALGERLGRNEIVAFAVLVIGSALIARGGATSTVRQRHAYTAASFAAIFFAASTVLMKAIFLQQAFIPGFVWSRAGALLAALLILFHAPSRSAILRPQERPKKQLFGLFLGGQVVGAIGFLSLQYAVSMASPTLVNALQGVQYGFLFILTALLGRTLPQLRERLTRPIVLQKILALVVITVGLAMLANSSS